MENKTKVIAKIGPAMFLNGLYKKAPIDVFWINFSHGTLDEKQEVIDNVRKVRPDAAILGDLPGPKMRFSEGFENTDVGKGVEIILGGKRKDNEFPIDCKDLHKHVKPGMEIFIDDARLVLKVKSVKNGMIICETLNSGKIRAKSGIDVPTIETESKDVVQNDLPFLKFSAKNNLEFVGISFVQSKESILKYRKKIEEFGGRSVGIVAKIEVPVAVKNIDSIIGASDAIMVARGDLAVSVGLENISSVQRSIIKKCNMAGKPVITATQMLASMETNDRPTRAEANDIYWAIQSGTDACALSNETAVGVNPMAAIEWMIKISKNAENDLDSYNPYYYAAHREPDRICLDAFVHWLHKQDAKIMALTNSGYTARHIAKFRPKCGVIAVTYNINIARKLQMCWGVKSVLMDKADFKSPAINLNAATHAAVKAGLLKTGDNVIIAYGSKPGTTDTLVSRTVKNSKNRQDILE